MSWLLFMDESGHDHKVMPYEVRGGIALHAGKLWAFVQAMRRLEREAFGTELVQFKKEVKGSKLLDRNRFEWAAQAAQMPPDDRRRYSRKFLTAGLEKRPPARHEFTAYGQANLEMARGIFRLLEDYDAVLFAVAIPMGRGGKPQKPDELRRDHKSLLRKYEQFLRERNEYGLLVMDETEKTADRGFVRRGKRSLHSA